MKCYRAAILRFDAHHNAVYEPDGLLAVGPGPSGTDVVQAVGPYRELAGQFALTDVEHLPGRIIAPGFLDLHVHYPQIDMIGSPASGLLPWLENYTFPQEARFADPVHAAGAAEFFLGELLRNGVTTALAFATSHPQSVDAFFSAAARRGLRMITGKVLQDRHSPDGVRDDMNRAWSIAKP